MQPEISHRCPSCGVSIRIQGALFCPECGKPLATAESAQESQSVHSETEKSPDISEEANEKASPQSTTVNSQPAPAGSAPVATARQEAGYTARPNQAADTPAVSAGSGGQKERTAARYDPANTADNVAGNPRRGEKTRERLHHASAVARGVIEGEVKRVEKIRHVSSVVIEEASYDPSLRFVLVALGLFVVFVILLILSKVMG